MYSYSSPLGKPFWNGQFSQITGVAVDIVLDKGGESRIY